jgi:hypothetical protein
MSAQWLYGSDFSAGGDFDLELHDAFELHFSGNLGECWAQVTAYVACAHGKIISPNRRVRE